MIKQIVYSTSQPSLISMNIITGDKDIQFNIFNGKDIQKQFRRQNDVDNKLARKF